MRTSGSFLLDFGRRNGISGLVETRPGMHVEEGEAESRGHPIGGRSCDDVCGERRRLSSRQEGVSARAIARNTGDGPDTAGEMYRPWEAPLTFAAVRGQLRNSAPPERFRRSSTNSPWARIAGAGIFSSQPLL